MNGNVTKQSLWYVRLWSMIGIIELGKIGTLHMDCNMGNGNSHGET